MKKRKKPSKNKALPLVRRSQRNHKRPAHKSSRRNILGIKPPDLGGSEHPLRRGKYILLTPMVRKLGPVALSWVDLSFPGNMVIGEPRTGKTRARRYMADYLPRKFPGIVVYSMNCEFVTTPSAGGFFRRICRAASNELAAEAEVHKIRAAVGDFIVSEVKRSGQDRVVFLFDEAQHLKLPHYLWLVDLTNHLEEHHLSPTIILFGQPELLARRAEFEVDGRENIVGRFMKEHFRLKGMGKVSDVQTCLRGYDDPDLMDYPTGSKWSFSRFFFPQAFADGWRLESEADRIWSAYDRVRRINGVRGEKLVVSSQDFIRFVQLLIVRISHQRNGEFAVSNEELERLIVEAGYGRATNSADDRADSANE